MRGCGSSCDCESTLLHITFDPDTSTAVKCANLRLDWIGLFHLFKLFLRYCYELEDPKADLFSHTYVPRPNDFSDIAEYFVRNVCCSA